MKFIPHKYQDKATNFVLATPKCALWLDMGLGKTVSTLTAVSRIQDACESRGVLIVAPLRVASLTWPDEVSKWDHTGHLRVRKILGEEKERMAALRAKGDIWVINYENLIWLVTKAMHKLDGLPFDMIVFDESSKMKSASSRRFKIMKTVMDQFDRVVELTGTPAPQSYEDLWSQIYLLDGGERLGRFVTHFRDRYFKQVDPYGHQYILRPGAKEAIEEKIKDLVLCMKAEDYLEMPQLTINKIKVVLPDAVREDYNKLKREMFLQLEDDKGIEALNAASLSSKLRQFTSGAVYDDPVLNADGRPVGERKWHAIHEAKMEALDDILEESSGQPVLVVYEFKHELARLRAKYPKAPWIGGGAKEADSVKAVRDWNAGKVPVMLVHPASVGHGINLQYGGHIMVWTSGTWSLELYEQTVARLYRQGQSRPVIVHMLYCAKTVDETVLWALESKETNQAKLLAALGSCD